MSSKVFTLSIIIELHHFRWVISIHNPNTLYKTYGNGIQRFWKLISSLKDSYSSMLKSHTDLL